MTNNISQFSIAGQIIGPSERPYCIAEVGINHNGDLTVAKKMIDAAKLAGADAVKFQTFKAEEFCGDATQKYTYQSQGREVTESMLEMFQRYEFSQKIWVQIKSYCEEVGIIFFSTPQNTSDLEILQGLGVPALKIGSDDFTNLPLIRRYVESRLPLILSCGMSDMAEVHQALEAAKWFEGYPVVLMLCTSQYPTPPEDVNITKLTTLRNAFPELLVGFSDHTQGFLAASLAVALGARVFEKHFTLDKNMAGPDHWFSEDPIGLAEWIKNIHIADVLLGNPIVRPTDSERKMRLIARRSVVALRNILCGETLSFENTGIRRPGGGLPPSFIEKVIGLKSARDINKDELILLGDVKA